MIKRVGLLTILVVLFSMAEVVLADKTKDICRAAAVGDIESIKTLLRSDPKLVIAKTTQGYTPLHCAALEDQEKAAEVLIENGADINARSGLGDTPLHVAARNGSRETAELLLSSGADINAKNNSGYTPLEVALFNGEKSVADLLHKRGADDSFAQTLLEIPEAQWEDFLTKNKSNLKDGLVENITFKAKKHFERGEYNEACQAARLADLADYFRLDRTEYRALNQYGLSMKLIKKNEIDKALLIAEEIIKKDPKNHYGHLLAGKIYLLKNIQFDKAEDEIKQALAANPQSEDAHFALACIYSFKENYEAALEEFYAVLKINPHNGFAKDRVADLTGQSKTKTLSADSDALLHFHAARQLFDKGMFKEAISDYQKAIEKDPKFAKAYLYMGTCYFKLGDNNKTIELYKKSIELNPTDCQAHRFLGDVYERLYDYTNDVNYLDHAITCYQNAIKANPDYETAKSDLERAQKKKTGK